MYRAPPLIDQARLLATLARGLGPFFRDVLPAEEAKARLARRLAAREANFAQMIQHGIFRVEHSPIAACSSTPAPSWARSLT